MKKIIAFLLTFSLSAQLFAQQQGIFTSGLFLEKRHYEIKVFNNLYTQRTAKAAPDKNRRDNYLTSFIQLTFGGSKVNFGIDGLLRSQLTDEPADASPFRVLSFRNEAARPTTVGGYSFERMHKTTLSHLGGRLRFQPLKNKQFTVQQALYVPTTAHFDNRFIYNGDIFYDQPLGSGGARLFLDAGVWWNFNNSTSDPLPYFKVFVGCPILPKTGAYVVLNLPYEIGGGVKYFFKPNLELEFLYTHLLPMKQITDNRRAATFNLGLRYSDIW